MSDEAINDDINEAEAGEPVISEEEKEALLDGIASGEIEVHSSNGPKYAEVADYVISSRSYIVTNSYPRLELLNKSLCLILSKRVEKMLNVPAQVRTDGIRHMEFHQLTEGSESVSMVIAISVEPLEGRAFLYLEAPVVAQLVESFFGGKSEEQSTQNKTLFTTGERAVSQKFGQEILAALGETWESMTPIKPELQGLNLCTDIIEGIDAGTPVVSCEFTLDIGADPQPFRVLWPEDTVKPLIPAFKDQKREVDPAQDAMWNKVISKGVTDTSVPLSCEVGRTTMSLRDVVELQPGDVIPIDNPRHSTIFARGVPVLKGLFGVHDSHHAVEATNWISNQPAKAG